MKRGFLSFILFYILLFPFLESKAQAPRILKGGGDISSNMVDYIYKDHDGVMWICTENGLNRLDGAKNVTLYCEQGGSPSFSSIVQDSKNRYWVCGSDNVLLYENTTEKLIPIKAYFANSNEMVIHPSRVVERRDGTILACTSGHGIFRLEEKNGEYCFRQDTKTFPYYFTSRMLEDNWGNLWVSTEDGIVCFSRKKKTVIQCGTKDQLRYFSDIIQGKDGNIWCCNSAGGVWRINPKTMKADEVPGMSDMRVHCLIMGRKDALLAGTNERGVWHIEAATLKVSELGVSHGILPDDKLNVHAIGEDSHKNIWVGCYQRGVFVHPHEENRFRYIGRNSALTNIIGSSCVMSMSLERSGRLWVASDGDGLYSVSGTQSVHYAPAPGKMPKTIMSQYIDSKGRLWFGTWMQGLWVMDPVMGVASNVSLPVKNTTGSVFGITEDHKGNLWIGTQGDGVVGINLATGEKKVLPMVDNGLQYRDDKNLIPNNWVNCLTMTPEGILFFGTCDGLGAYDTNTGKLTSVFKGKNRMFGGLFIITLRYTADKHLWIGTNKGLYCLDTKTMKTRIYHSDDGLTGNIIQAIVDDGKGSLWISTNYGLSHLNIKTGRIVSYSSNDGMYGNEFSKNAAVMSADGNVYFGGTDGICFFNPSNISSWASKINVIVSGLYINGELANASTLSKGKPVMDIDILHAKEITLSYDDNNFSLEFSTLNQLMGTGVSYEYRVDNGPWQALPAGTNTVSFSNLKSGTHHIYYRASNGDNYTEEKELIVNIRTPWYLSWWASIIYLLLFVMAIMSLINYVRQRQKNAINELQLRQHEQISEAKMQFFMNISHEIRTPMTLVMSPLQRLISSDKDATRQSAYMLMHRNAQRILHLVNQMLDVRKVDKGQMKLSFQKVPMVEYMNKLVDGFQDLCTTKNIRLSFSSEVKDLDAWVDTFNFDKIVINLLSNAFKYTPKDGEIKVSLLTTDGGDNSKPLVLTREELNRISSASSAGGKATDTVSNAANADLPCFCIRVEDSGSGIDEEQIKHIYERFFQQKNSTNSAIQGSGIGLNLTRSLVELHHGTITCANNGEGKPGCHFLVMLPLGNAHLTEEEMSTEEIQEELTPYKAYSTEAEKIPQASMFVSPEEQKADHAPKSRRRILIVEDDIEIRAYLKSELSSDFVVTTATNGEEAMQAIRHKKPDLVISDVMMPVMDGMELLSQIRRNTTINGLPVILLTAKTTDQDKIAGLEQGADAYIAKPFNIEVLRRTVANLIGRHVQLKNIYSGSQNPEVENKVKMVSPDERLMQRIMKVINANLDNPELGNDLITREVGISRVHLYRKLKELTNLSLRDFLRDIRLTEAARLLSEQKHSISEVASRTGFDNVSYFTVVFKQRYGVPPSQYKDDSASASSATEDGNAEE